MARLYANENFPLPVVQGLRQLGHDVLTTADAGNAGQAVPDDQVLDFAIRDARALLSVNRRHFLRLAKERPEHSGMILCTFDPDFSRQAQAIHAQLLQQSQLKGLILRVNRPN